MIITLYQEIARVLTPDELDDVLKYIVEDATYAEIGKTKSKQLIAINSKQEKSIVNDAKKRGYRRISSILRKIKQMRTSSTYIICKEFLLDNPSMKEMRTPSFHIGWLCETLKKINNGGYWGKTHNKRTYKSRQICLIPEYLQESFGDSSTKCTICGIKCKRKKDN